MAFLLGGATTLLVVQSFGFWRWHGQPSETESGRIVHRINLNRAERAELLQLPGVGESLAQRIEDRRSTAGGFRSVEELREVSGIGPAALERLRPWVYVNASEVDKEPTGQPRTATEQRAPIEKGPAPVSALTYGSKKIAELKEPINLNQATVEELQRLPGIGPKLSQRIVEERQKGLFKSVEDLHRVPGIGPKTIERLRPFVATESKLPAVTRAG
jgi:competence protein ComEA